jgi:hypothetical protein
MNRSKPKKRTVAAMTDKDLDEALRLAEVPERSAAYWKGFPARVTQSFGLIADTHEPVSVPASESALRHAGGAVIDALAYLTLWRAAEIVGRENVHFLVFAVSGRIKKAHPRSKWVPFDPTRDSMFTVVRRT